MCAHGYEVGVDLLGIGEQSGCRVAAHGNGVYANAGGCLEFFGDLFEEWREGAAVFGVPLLPVAGRVFELWSYVHEGESAAVAEHLDGGFGGAYA